MRKHIFGFTIFILLATRVLAIDTLVIGIKHAPPFIIIDSVAHEYSGLCIDFWESIASKNNYAFKYEEYDLAGILSSLADSSVDMCINPLSVTSERLKTIDFSQPIYVSNLGVAVKQVNKSVVISIFENIFSWDFIKIVLILVLILFVVGIILWIFERKKNQEQFRDGYRGVFDAFWWSAVTMTTVGYGDKSPVTGVGRFVAGIWMFVAVITISSFTASISSSLTVDRMKYNISSINDLDRYSVGTVGGSSSAMVLKTKSIDFNEYNSVNTLLDALEQDEIETILFDKPILQYEIFNKKYDNTISVLSEKFNAQYYSFSFPKGSELYDDFNYLIIKELENEKWTEILSKYHLLK